MAHMNVSLADELATELKERVAPRQRSAFIATALKEKLERLRQEEAASAAAGVWSDDGRGDATEEIRALRSGWTGRAGDEATHG
jgi:metal-responsive CopG/Arc/MetJ family transcriptional regulator